MRARAPGVLATLAVVLVAGCAGSATLPTSSGVHAVRVIQGQDPLDEDVRKVPPGPVPGESPVQVVAGFLRAASQVSVARQFLAPGTPWADAVGVSVYSDNTQPQPVLVAHDATGGAVVDLALRLVGTLDSDGQVSLPQGTAARHLRFHVARVRQQWRIGADVPPGVLLPVRDLALTRRLATLAWLAPTKDVLVQQPVLLAPGDDGLAVAAVRALLAGPPNDLPVVSAFPTAAQLNSVDTSTPVAVVDLTQQVAQLSADDLHRLRVQLAATLIGLSGVTGVRVLANGQQLPGDEVTTAVNVADLDAEKPPSPLRAVVAGPAGLQLLGSGSPGVGRGGLAVGATDLAVSPDGRHIAWLAPAAHGLVRLIEADAARAGDLPTGGARPVGPPGAWTSVSWGRDGSVWLVRADTTQPLWLIPSQSGVPVAVGFDSSALADRPVALQLARDGVGVSIRTAATRVYAGAVRGGANPAVTDLHVVAPSLTKVTAMSAQDGAGGLLLAGNQDGVRGVWRVASAPANPLSGDEALVPTPVYLGAPCPHGVTGLAAAPAPSGSAAGPVLALCGGHLWTSGGSGWTTGRVATAAAWPGG